MNVLGQLFFASTSLGEKYGIKLTTFLYFSNYINHYPMLHYVLGNEKMEMKERN